MGNPPDMNLQPQDKLCSLQQLGRWSSQMFLSSLLLPWQISHMCHVLLLGARRLPGLDAVAEGTGRGGNLLKL